MTRHCEHEEYVTLPAAVFQTEAQARQLLGRVYPDLSPRLVMESRESWRYCMEPRSHEVAKVDPDLAQNLSSCFGLDFSHVFSWHRQARCAAKGQAVRLEAFNHSWALLAWSQWLASSQGQKVRPLLLHLDSHDDLGRSCLLATAEPGVFTTLFDDEEMRMADPASVESYLSRGLIGIGNFIAPFLCAVGACDILHLQPDLGDTRQTIHRALHVGSEPVAGAFQPLACRIDSEELSETDSPPPFTYTRSSSWESLRRETWKDRTILLDIDLDYFALLPSRTPPGTPPLCPNAEAIAAQIGYLSEIFRHDSVKDRIAVTTIAYSPGFFPSGHWRTAIPRLRTALDLGDTSEEGGFAG